MPGNVICLHSRDSTDDKIQRLLCCHTNKRNANRLKTACTSAALIKDGCRISSKDAVKPGRGIHMDMEQFLQEKRLKRTRALSSKWGTQRWNMIVSYKTWGITERTSKSCEYILLMLQLGMLSASLFAREYFFFSQHRVELEILLLKHYERLEMNRLKTFPKFYFWSLLEMRSWGTSSFGLTQLSHAFVLRWG